MQNWNNISELTRLHREDLLREVSADRRASEIDKPERISSAPRASVSLRRIWSPVLALVALLVGTHR
ncbi:MAG TPA: hypothetical protein VGK15_00195 [Candidatus Limnocylindria bacterium]|jgi:hypothetical protein